MHMLWISTYCEMVQSIVYIREVLRYNSNFKGSTLARSTALVNFIPGICAVILPITENACQSVIDCMQGYLIMQTKNFNCEMLRFLITYAYTFLNSTTLYLPSLAAS